MIRTNISQELVVTLILIMFSYRLCPYYPYASGCSVPAWLAITARLSCCAWLIVKAVSLINTWMVAWHLSLFFPDIYSLFCHGMQLGVVSGLIGFQ